MPKYQVTLHDGRTIDAHAPSPEGAMKQAKHHETTRIVIATKRGHPTGPDVSSPCSVTKVKD